jgi:pimeloyl-ACP methyl ester carboxylesterase
MIRAEYHELDGAIGFVEVAGEGTPLLCIHSAGQSGVQWRAVLRELSAQGFTVIVPDLPGHGRSENSPAGAVTDLRYYAQWLTTLLERLEVREPMIAGCSIGGKIALQLALDERLAPRAVVAMAADARNGRLSVAGLTRGLEDAASPSRSDRTFLGTLASLGTRTPDAIAERIAAMHRREDPVVSTADLIAWTTHDVREQLRDIRCPVRLIAGEQDFWIDLGDTRWAAEQIEGCIYEELPGVGHYPMEEISGFPQLLAGWLAELERVAES